MMIVVGTKQRSSHRAKKTRQLFCPLRRLTVRLSDTAPSCHHHSERRTKRTRRFFGRRQRNWNRRNHTHVDSTRGDEKAEHVKIKAHPKLNPNLNPKRLGFRVRV